MFDSLKDKLGRFKDDVEETAEAVDEEAEPESADAASQARSETDIAEADSKSEPDPATEEPPEPDTEGGSEDRTGQPAFDAPVDTGTDDEGDGEGSDRGFAARAGAALTGKTFIEEEDLEGPLRELELALLSSDVEMGVAERILENIREELVGTTRAQVTSTGLVVEDALREALLDVISVGQFDFHDRIQSADKPVTIIFTGVNGVGKTTTIAKLARYFEEQGLSTVLANGDTYRAGANEQLREHAEALDKRIITHEQGGDPAAVIYDAVEYAQANDIDVVLGDTAGRLHTSNDLMAQLEKIDRVVDPDMTLFVDEAVAGQDAVQRAREFDDAAEIDGAVLTKADADAQGGAAISIAFVTGKPILFLGTGQGYNDLERFDPKVIVDRLLGEEE